MHISIGSFNPLSIVPLTACDLTGLYLGLITGSSILGSVQLVSNGRTISSY